VLVPIISFTLHEYDPDQPWIITNSTRKTIDLPSVLGFWTWVNETYPRPRWEVVPDPWQLEPARDD